jgi:hypothetical protein
MCELSLAPSVPQVSLRMRPAVWVRDSGNAPGWSGHAGARPKGRRAAYNQLPVLANACRPAPFFGRPGARPVPIERIQRAQRICSCKTLIPGCGPRAL